MSQPQRKKKEDAPKNHAKHTENIKSTPDVVESSKTYNIHNTISIIVGAISICVILALTADECVKCFSKLNNFTTVAKPAKLKKFAAYGHNLESGYLKNVFEILDRLGFEKVDANSTDNDWDLLWAHDYPFRVLAAHLRKLKPHQKVNHFPGCGYITNKVDLAVSGLKYIPPAFKLPHGKEKLLEYAASHPNVSFVEKNNDHRNIHIRKLSEINLEAEGTFVQEFVDKPLLVSGYKFDIGIYTIITSIDPLRVYIYNGEALLRFCPVEYYPFDPDNIDKYVVGDDYLPTWEVPALNYYYNTLGFGMRESLNAYLRSKNKDPTKIWRKIEDSLRIVLLANEQKIAETLRRYPSKHNFFEMMRFDFVANEDLDVFLMEANMSPNLSSAHFPPNRLLFEQVIFNLFGLVGVAERVKKDSLAVRSQAEEEMQSADKNIMVFPTQCNSAFCRSSCVSPICQLCRPCLTKEMKSNLIRAHREYMNRGDCKRIFPPPIKRSDADETLQNIENYSPENQLMIRWFQGKCQLDESWC